MGAITDREQAPRELLLAAMFPFTALALLNCHWRPLLQGPAWWLVDALQFVLVPASCWGVLQAHGVTSAQIGLRWRRERHGVAMDSVGTWVLGGMVVVAATAPVAQVLQRVFWYDPGVAGIPDVPREFLPRLGIALYLSAGAALVEEAVFRGLAWRYFQRAWPAATRAAAYVVLTSTVFAACHSEQGIGGVLAAGWFGVVTALGYLRWRTLWPCVAGHFCCDMIVFGPW